nr:hypothetical protein Iba_chr02aCG7040 [Ipomoea batatas]
MQCKHENWMVILIKAAHSLPILQGPGGTLPKRVFGTKILPYQCTWNGNSIWHQDILHCIYLS